MLTSGQLTDASSLPTNARVLVGAVSQLQASLKDAARAHGAGALAAWARGVLPAVSRPIVMAWLFTFCGVELCADGSDGHHLSGRVTDVAFRGRGYEHAVDVDGSTRLTGVFARTRVARGETVGLRLNPDGCHMFPADK